MRKITAAGAAALLAAFLTACGSTGSPAPAAAAPAGCTQVMGQLLAVAEAVVSDQKDGNALGELSSYSGIIAELRQDAASAGTYPQLSGQEMTLADDMQVFSVPAVSDAMKAIKGTCS
jgi:hypothetical protein